MKETLILLGDYIRMVSYGTIIICSLRNVTKRKFNNILFIGDILMALFLLIGNLLAIWFGLDRADIGTFMNCPVIIWAIIHFRAMIISNEEE